MTLARMLVTVSFILILTASPTVALSITRSIVSDGFLNRRYIFLLCHAIYLELGMLNCSGLNFVVFVLRSSWFGQELARFVCFRIFEAQKGRTEHKAIEASSVSSSQSL